MMCISFSKLYANRNVVSEIIVSETINQELDTSFFLVKTFDKIKIPIVKKDVEKRLWFLPVLLWNNYDKTQVGICLGVDIDSLASVKILPMYATASRNLTGIVNSSFYIMQKKRIPLTLSLQARRFSYKLFPEDLSYNKIAPSLEIGVIYQKAKAFSITLRHTSIWQEFLYNGRKTTYFNVHDVSSLFYLRENKVHVSLNNGFNLANDFGILRSENEIKVSFDMHHTNFFTARLFGGIFLYNNKSSNQIEAPAPQLLLTGTPNLGIYWLQKDYMFNSYYLDRNAEDNFFRHQTTASDGGFHSFSTTGNANQFLFSLNLKSDVMLPIKIKRFVNIQPYLNIAYSKNKNIIGDIYAEGGASLLLFQEVIGIYVPFATSKNIQLNQSSVLGLQRGDWPKKITFSIDLIKLKNVASR